MKRILALARFRARNRSSDERIKRLAAKINDLTEKDEGRIRHAHEVTAIRRKAGEELYQICWEFVEAVNALLAQPSLTIDPREPDHWEFRNEDLNFIQINIRGRILQVEYRSAPELISTEEFRVPYTLAGTVRA